MRYRPVCQVLISWDTYISLEVVKEHTQTQYDMLKRRREVSRIQTLLLCQKFFAIPYRAVHTLSNYLYTLYYMWAILQRLNCAYSDSRSRLQSTATSQDLSLPSKGHLQSYHQGCGSGSGSWSAWIRINLSCWVRIQIQEGKKDPQKRESKDISCFELLDVLLLRAEAFSCSLGVL